MKRERRQPTKAELASITSWRTVVRRIPRPARPRNKKKERDAWAEYYHQLALCHHALATENAEKAMALTRASLPVTWSSVKAPPKNVAGPARGGGSSYVEL